MLSKKTFFIIASFLMIFTSCEKEEEKNCIVSSTDSTNALGKVQGLSFNYIDGIVMSEMQDVICDRDSVFHFSLHNNIITEDKCSDKGYSSQEKIYFYTPQKVGIYEVSLCNQVTFITLKNGIVLGTTETECGAIEILEITDSTVTGTIFCKKNAENYVNGTFNIELCKYD